MKFIFGAFNILKIGHLLLYNECKKKEEVFKMAVYVMSDIHGEYEKFIEVLEKITLKDSDKLYILGDTMDRGPHPMKVLLKMMQMPNVIPIIGNHEVMFMECMPFLMGEITKESLEALDELDAEILDKILTWQYNGFLPTIKEFRGLDTEKQKDVLDYVGEFTAYEEVTVNRVNYLLVHAGLGNFSPEKELDDYTLDELVWERADYEMKYFEDTVIVTGHTPTQLIYDNPRKGYIYRNNNNIAIDCGACFENGRLAAICLDTGEEFYSSDKKL